MSCCSSKDCDNHQNSSFIFGLIIGLIIAAIIAIVIYKNNKDKVFEDLKKKLESFFDVFKTPTYTSSVVKHSPKKNKTHIKPVIKKGTSNPKTPQKIPVVLPSKLIAAVSETKPVSRSKPRTFKK